MSRTRPQTSRNTRHTIRLTGTEDHNEAQVTASLQSNHVLWSDDEGVRFWSRSKRSWTRRRDRLWAYSVDKVSWKWRARRYDTCQTQIFKYENSNVVCVLLLSIENRLQRLNFYRDVLQRLFVSSIRSISYLKSLSLTRATFSDEKSIYVSWW